MAKAAKAAAAVSVPPPERAMAVTDYRIDALRWSDHAPINPNREHHEAAGYDVAAPDAPPARLDPLPAPADLRPARAHTVSWERHDENAGQLDQLAGLRPLQDIQLNVSAPGAQLPEPVQRNLFRFQPGQVRDQAPFTVGGTTP